MNIFIIFSYQNMPAIVNNLKRFWFEKLKTNLLEDLKKPINGKQFSEFIYVYWLCNICTNHRSIHLIEGNARFFGTNRNHQNWAIARETRPSLPTSVSPMTKSSRKDCRTLFILYFFLNFTFKFFWQVNEMLVCLVRRFNVIRFVCLRSLSFVINGRKKWLQFEMILKMEVRNCAGDFKL